MKPLVSEIFFAAFAFVIYPNKELLHMSMESIQSYQAAYPNLHWFIPVIGNWSFSLFYILSEEQFRKGGYERNMSFYGPRLGPWLVEQFTEIGHALR